MSYLNLSKLSKALEIKTSELIALVEALAEEMDRGGTAS